MAAKKRQTATRIENYIIILRTTGVQSVEAISIALKTFLFELIFVNTNNLLCDLQLMTLDNKWSKNTEKGKYRKHHYYFLKQLISKSRKTLAIN